MARGSSTFCVSRFRGGRWQPARIVTAAESNAYYPALTVNPQTGDGWLAYCAVDPNRQYSVFRGQVGSWQRSAGEPVAVAVGGVLRDLPNLNKYPSILCDATGRVWIAYERDSERSRRQRNECCNHMGFRECSVVCLQEGKLYRLKGSGSDHDGRNVLSGANDHLPELRLHPAGGLWIFSRDSVTEAAPPWNIRAAYLAGAARWSAPVRCWAATTTRSAGQAGCGFCRRRQSLDCLAERQSSPIHQGNELLDCRGPDRSAKTRTIACRAGTGTDRGLRRRPERPKAAGAAIEPDAVRSSRTARSLPFLWKPARTLAVFVLLGRCFRRHARRRIPLRPGHRRLRFYRYDRPRLPDGRRGMA